MSIVVLDAWWSVGVVVVPKDFFFYLLLNCLCLTIEHPSYLSCYLVKNKRNYFLPANFVSVEENSANDGE